MLHIAVPYIFEFMIQITMNKNTSTLLY